MASKLLANVINVPKRFEHCSFGTFKTNKENETIFEICKKWDAYESITLTGKPGTGKTHLAISMLKNFPMVEEKNEMNIRYQKDKAEKLLKSLEQKEEKGKIEKYLKDELYNYRKAKCLFTPFVELFIEINSYAMSDDGKMSILRKYSQSTEYDCICFDDLGAEKLTEAKRENLYYIIDARYRNMLPTIITSNFTIQEISEVEPRIASRFAEMGKILQFDGYDYRKTH